MWAESFGLEETNKLCRANNLHSALAIRANTLKISREHLLKVLEEQGLKVKKSIIIPEGLIVESAGDLSILPAFQEGLFYVQAESSMAVSRVVSPREGEVVLDCCAAPGGKTTHMAQLMQDKGRIIAVDIHPDRLKLVKENAQRLGIGNVETKQGDVTKLDCLLTEQVDKILVDAPCSGLGVLARRPDARWRKNLAGIEELSILQSSLLNSAAPLVKRGGVLVYSVCTITHQEGKEVVEGFLKSHSDFALDDAVPYLSQSLRSEEPFRWAQLLPHKHGTDGMFIARMIRH